MTHLLKENDIAPIIIELNMDTVQELRGEGIAAVYGDGIVTSRISSDTFRWQRAPAMSWNGPALISSETVVGTCFVIP
ncbi:MAG: hypothetical protein WD768_16295 [Phycisphaeraceae bacterium]